MLSRAVKVSTRVASKAAPVSASMFARRATSTTAVAVPAATPAVPANATALEIGKLIDSYSVAPQNPNKTFFAGLGEIIKENGMYPFLALGTAALFTKEILLVSPELLVMTDFMILASVGYIFAAESIETGLNKQRAEYITKINNVWDARSAVVKAHLEACKSALALPEVVTEANAAFVEANAAAATARDLVEKQKHRDATVAKLTALYNKEQEKLNAIREAVFNKSKDYVLSQVSTPAVKSALLKEAIALVGAKEDKTGTFAAVDALIADAIKKAKATA